MTVSKTLFQQIGRLLATALVSGLALWLSTASLLAQPATSSNRFLFIIDTSSSMKAFDKGVQDSLFELIYSGVRGHMTNGDTYGIWLMNEENDMSFKMEMWRQKFTVEMGARAALHVKEHGFKGKLDLAQAMHDALAVIQGVGDLTVILISNGETPVSQTPFDDVINARYRELAPAMKRKKATINTVLAAQDGKLLAWAVNSPDYVVEIPSLPPKPKPPAPPIVLAPSSAVTNATRVAVAPVPAEPARARANVSPIIITKDIVAQERRQFLALASTLTNEPGAVSAVTNPAPNPVPEAVVAAAANVLANATNMASVVKTGLVPATNLPATNVAVMNSKPEATNLAVAAPPASTGPAATPPVGMAPAYLTAPPASEPHSASSPLWWVAIGAGAAFVCMFSVLLVTRARRPEPSLVSQAIIRERLRAS